MKKKGEGLNVHKHNKYVENQSVYFKTAASNELAKDLQLQSKKQGENYDGVVRDPSDLISSKQALRILYNDGVDETTLYQLNFGNLDVDAVIDEIAPKEESFRQETNTDLFQLRDEFFSEDWGQKTATEFTNTIRYYGGKIRDYDPEDRYDKQNAFDEAYNELREYFEDIEEENAMDMENLKREYDKICGEEYVEGEKEISAVGFDELGNAVVYEYRCLNPDCKCVGSRTNGNKDKAVYWING